MNMKKYGWSVFLLAMVADQMTHSSEVRKIGLAEVVRLFDEPLSVSNEIRAPQTSVIYRFFALAPELHQRSFAVVVKVGLANEPLSARPGEFTVKIEKEEGIPIRTLTGVLPSGDIEDLVSIVHASEIFLLEDRDQPGQTDDGGAYPVFKKPLGYQYFFERTNESGQVVVSRLVETSIPAKEAASPFVKIAEEAFSKLMKAQSH